MHFDELQEIGLNLASWRKSKGYSQADLGQKVNINRQTISDIERGKFTGSLGILLRYTNYAGFNLSISPKTSKYPNLDELSERYGEDDDEFS